MNKYTEQQKIDFFDTHWVHISKILDVLQKSRDYIPAGTNLLEFLANWLDRNFTHD